MKAKTVVAALLAGGGFLTAWQANAGDDSLRRVTVIDAAKPSVQQVNQALFPPEITDLKKECAAMEKQGFRCQSVVPKSSLDTVQVTFPRGSAELTQDGKDFLEAVGESLKSHPEEAKLVLIEGHTDSTGTDQINTALSLRRAEAVKTFLAGKFGLTNISTAGLGSKKLRDPQSPTAEINRRIEIVIND